VGPSLACTTVSDRFVRRGIGGCHFIATLCVARHPEVLVIIFGASNLGYAGPQGAAANTLVHSCGPTRDSDHGFPGGDHCLLYVQIIVHTRSANHCPRRLQNVAEGFGDQRESVGCAAWLLALIGRYAGFILQSVGTFSPYSASASFLITLTQPLRAGWGSGGHAGGRGHRRNRAGVLRGYVSASYNWRSPSDPLTGDPVRPRGSSSAGGGGLE